MFKVNKLTDIGIIQIAKALRKNKRLRKLTLGFSRCEITDEGVKPIADFIYKNKEVQIFCLNLSSIS